MSKRHHDKSRQLKKLVRQEKKLLRQGYDIEMLRDFYDHLLLEVRVQQFEDLTMLRKSQKDKGEMVAVMGEISPKLVAALTKYTQKYASALIYVSSFDPKDATEEEVSGVALAMATANTQKRDEQIGHLEALRELFDEALQCTKPGGKAQPTRRSATQMVGNKKVKVVQPDNRGYDVKMLSDFLEHIQLSLLVRHHECQQRLRELGGLPEPPESGEADISDTVIQQLATYAEKYDSVLLRPNSSDTNESAADEIDTISELKELESDTQKRREQLSHIEALGELFDEALQCAKVPFFQDQKTGWVCQPIQWLSVREMVDSTIETPDYDELLPNFDGTELTTPMLVQGLKSADIIFAEIGETGRRLLIYGKGLLNRSAKESKSRQTKTLPVPIEDVEELQFLVASVKKYKGRHEYRGNYYDAFSL